MATVEELEKELAETKAKAEENVKALQQKLTEKDLATKQIQDEIAKLKEAGKGDSEADKKIENLTKEIEKLTGTVSEFTSDKQRNELKSKYPDILPELLLGKTPEEIDRIVKAQREITMQNFDEKPSAHGPIYKSTNEIDEEIERVTKDSSLSVDVKLERVRELKLKKEEV